MTKLPRFWDSTSTMRILKSCDTGERQAALLMEDQIPLPGFETFLARVSFLDDGAFAS